MNLHDIEAQAKALAPILREYVIKSVETAQKSAFEAIESRFSELKTWLSGQIPAPIDLDQFAQKAAELIPVPKDGEPGEPGKSVTAEDVQPLVDEAVVKAISAIPMPKNGEPGKKGDPGESIPVETVQAMIDEAVAKAVSAIEKPADGKPGRDALELDILPYIGAEKSYPRGTWATHNGGLWRSYQTTEGLKGWECIVDGVASFDIEQVDARNVAAVSRLASGKEVRKSFAIPAMIYRNVWREGLHQRGDVVTFGGCAWHCNEDTDTKPGDNNKCWTLMVKKGRDAKA